MGPTLPMRIYTHRLLHLPNLGKVERKGGARRQNSLLNILIVFSFRSPPSPLLTRPTTLCGRSTSPLSPSARQTRWTDTKSLPSQRRSREWRKRIIIFKCPSYIQSRNRRFFCERNGRCFTYTTILSHVSIFPSWSSVLGSQEELERLISFLVEFKVIQYVIYIP